LHLEATEPLIRFDDTNSGLHYILGQDGDGFKFTTNNSTYGKYTFDSSVGIGTSSPSGLLEISADSDDGTSAPSFLITNASTTLNDGAVVGTIEFRNSDASGTPPHTAKIQGIANASDERTTELAFSTGSIGTTTEGMRLNSTGLGIGTTSPSKKLEVAGDIRINSAFPRLYLTDSDSNSDFSIINNNGKFSIYDDTNSTYRMAIDSAGNVGIGTASPAEELHVFNAGNTTVQIQTTGGGTPTLKFTSPVGTEEITTGVGSIRNMVFRIGGSERARFDASGNLLVGTTENNVDNNTSGKGIVLGSGGYVQIAREATAQTQGMLMLNATGVDAGMIEFKKDAVAVGSIGNNGNRPYFASTNCGIRLGAADLLPATSTGVISDNVLSLGSSVGRWKDLHLSGQAYASYFRPTPSSADFINFSSGNIRFATGSSEKARFDTSGNFLCGTTNTTPAFGTGNGTAIRTGEMSHISRSGGTPLALNRASSDGDILSLRKDGTQVGSISTASGTTSYNTSSDARLKDVTGEARGLEVITKLNPVAYNWKADGKADEGLIAQEVKELVPNAVTGSEDEHYQMDYSKLVTHLVKGMKEQQEQIEFLKEEIANLKGE